MDQFTGIGDVFMLVVSPAISAFNSLTFNRFKAQFVALCSPPGVCPEAGRTI